MSTTQPAHSFMSQDQSLENNILAPSENIVFEDIPWFKERLAECISDFDKCKTGAQYVVFRGMTAEAFEKIEILRDRSYKGIRLSYNLADNILVVKIPGVVHGLSHTSISYELDYKLRVLGLRKM